MTKYNVPNKTISSANFKLLFADFVKYRPEQSLNTRIGTKKEIIDNAVLLAESLYEEYIESRKLSVKKLLCAGMLLRFFDTHHPSVDNKIMHNLNMLSNIEISLMNLIKKETLAFYAGYTVVAIDNYNHDYEKFNYLINTGSLAKINSLEHSVFITKIWSYCSNFYESIHRLSNIDNSILNNKATLEKIGTYVLQFRFRYSISELIKYSLHYKDEHSITKTIKDFNRVYDTAILILACGMEPSINSKDYCEIMERQISRIRNHYDPAYSAQIALDIIVKNQLILEYSDLLIARLCIIISDFLQSDASLAEKKEILLAIKRSFSPDSVYMFGKIISKSMNKDRFFAPAILELIYDLDLGLHDSQHLNNQINRLNSALFAHNHKQQLVVCDEDLIQHANIFMYYEIIMRRIACLCIQPKQNLQLTLEEIRKCKSFINTILHLTPSFITGTKIDTHILNKSFRCQATVITLRNIFNKLLADFVASGEKEITLTIKNAFISGPKQISTYSIQHATLSRYAEEFIFKLPQLPQGKIRFTSKQNINFILSYLINSCLHDITSRAPEDFDFSDPQIRAKIFIVINCRPSNYSLKHERKSAAPTDELIDYRSPLHRSITTSSISRLVL